MFWCQFGERMGKGECGGDFPSQVISEKCSGVVHVDKTQHMK